jgi:ATP-dependent DNA helicase RecQ
VLKWGHNNLSTYGIGADLPEQQWIYLARQLVQMGYLNQDIEFRTLSLTDKARAALKQRSPIMGRLKDVEAKAGKRETRKEEIIYNNALFALLSQKRKEMADEAGVPPYVIFSDKTLVEMASLYPQSPERLLDISGVGQVKDCSSGRGPGRDSRG